MLGLDVNVNAVQDATIGSGVVGGEALLAFADAVVSRDADAIQTAADRVAAVLGEEAIGDAAGVASNFERMVRIADATGIPLDDRMADASIDVRETLGLRDREGRDGPANAHAG